MVHGTNQLDFGGSLNQDPDLGFLVPETFH